MGNLQLERITWQTSCDLLQKVSVAPFMIAFSNVTRLIEFMEFSSVAVLAVLCSG